MKKTTNIAHPLKSRTGSSQGSRSREALSAQYAPIDGKTLGDRLYLIGQYAKLVNYYEVQKDLGGKEYLQADNWTDFFENSLPFQLANLSKTETTILKNQFSLLYEALKENPSPQTLEALLNFLYEKIILPASNLYSTVVGAGNSFGTSLLSIVKSSYQEPLRKFIALYNASITFLCVPKKKFDLFLQPPWQLGVQEIYALDPCIQQVKKGKIVGYLLSGKIASTLLDQFLSGLEEIVQSSTDYIEESLYPLETSLQKNHVPHLALMFTFLELFKHFQGNINELGKKHLDFFYKSVLQMLPKEAVADKAQLIFEIAKHIDDGYLLSEDLLLKDGKDTNNQEIQFGLDQELVLDKAKISELRSLSLYPVKDNDNKEYIEGVYMAPVSNSLDGKREKFKDKQANWATLGNKFSKQLQEGNPFADENPRARLGFVLASPVLLLQEGTREVKIILNCDFLSEEDPLTQAEVQATVDKIIANQQQNNFYLTENIVKNCAENLDDNLHLSVKAKTYFSQLLLQQNPYPIPESEWDSFFEVKDPISCLRIFSENDITQLKRCLSPTKKTITNPLFNISLSGEKEWISVSPNIKINIPVDGSILPNGIIQFEIVFTLDAAVPAVTFYNEAALKEKINLKQTFPLAKIELNEALKTPYPIEGAHNNRCCLMNEAKSSGTITVSPYDFLKKLTLTNAKIDVKVCGVKNLIVQNDDNLQDVNKPIMPFGPRPKVGSNWFIDGGANFYIGSKEIFCKNWKKFWINTTWKDKPSDLKNHYKFYKEPPFEDGSTEITETSFRFLTSVLEDGAWRKDLTIKLPPGGAPSHQELLRLFESFDTVSNTCTNTVDEATFSHGLSASFPEKTAYVPKSMTFEKLEPLNVNTRKGFLRLTLAGVSFQHDRFTYVLARQMMALAGLLDPESVAKVQSNLINSELLSDRAIVLINSILSKVNTIISNINSGQAQAASILSTAQLLKNNLLDVKNKFDSDPPAAKAALNQALVKIDTIINTFGNTANASTILGKLEVVKNRANETKTLIDANPGGGLTISDSEVENNLGSYGLQIIIIDLNRRIKEIKETLKVDADLGVPMEPYTPLIKSLSIDYIANAEIDDMEIVHLYPFENTSKHEDIQQKPTLFPYFDDEGTLYIGLEQLTPGNNLSLLFQLAEATADSEMDRAKINWHYLTNNNWQKLRPEFDVINDATDGLTVSGIVTIAIPDDISKEGNTVMPDKIYWIKVSAPSNVKAVAETIGIHTQAAQASARFGEVSDKERLASPLPAGSIAKLVNNDFNIKKVEQLYDSFGGRQPEASGHFYVRVSEHLKHKGRGIMIGDYEKIILEQFPEIYKVKCISHTMGLPANNYRRDLEVAPGYLIIAVIPDLTKLKSGNLLTPKAPISLLEKIGDHIRKKTSPFARIKVMNPRYEGIDVIIEVRLYKGKSSSFYAKKLKEEISQFLAPWFLGDSEKLAFGQEVLFSDLVGFVEQLDYIDFIINLELKGKCEQHGSSIKPLTARSILTGGDICVKINEEVCTKADIEIG